MEWPDSCLKKKLRTLPNQHCNVFSQRIGNFEPLQWGPRTGFSQRAEKRRQPDGKVFHARRQSVDDTADLRKHFQIQLREEHRQHRRFQIGAGLWCRQQTAQLLGDPLGGHAVQMAAQRLGRLPGGRVEGEAEPRREPVEPQDAQGVLLEPALRLPHGPDDARRPKGSMSPSSAL